MNDFTSTTGEALGFLSTIDFLRFELWGHDGVTYATALIAFVVFWIGLHTLQDVVIGRLSTLSKRTKNDIDDTLIRIVQTLRPPFFLFLSLYGTLQFFKFSSQIDRIFDVLLLVYLVYQGIQALSVLAQYILVKRMTTEEDPGAKSAMRFLNGLVKGILWLLGLLLILQNVGINISALLAGLGVGGIAIAFALQNVLEDLFSSFSIHFDKPFMVGDFIQVGDYSGEVQKIGVKTTRVKALRGEEIVISNRELTSTKIQNFGKLEERRVAVTFGLTYDTSNEKLKQVRGMIVEIISSLGDDVQFGRVHFKEFGASDLVFELVYFVSTDDYDRYMDVQEDLNLKLKETFEQAKIEFAYPTQTIIVQK